MYSGVFFVFFLYFVQCGLCSVQCHSVYILLCTFVCGLIVVICAVDSDVLCVYSSDQYAVAVLNVLA